MAKGNQPKGNPKIPLQKQAQPKVTAPILPQKDNSQLWLLIAIVAITFVVFFPALFNGFVLNWDDSGYITENKAIQVFNWSNIKLLFSNYYQANYHPLTMLTYAMEWAVVKDNPFLYHLDNVILHLINVALVFVFVKKLTGKIEIAVITTLLFGIHPLRVESVAWVAERKDVLYTCFFILSANFYIDYIQKADKKILNFGMSIFFIVLSLLSKPAAVCFPGVVVLLDWFFGRKINLKLVLEKIPYFAISLIFGIVAVNSQKGAGAIQNLTPLFTFFERIVLSFYAVELYLQKLLVPLGLSAMHPYPEVDGGHMLTKVYIAPVIVLAILVPVIFSFRKTKMIIFGTLFFFVNIALVLQLLPVGAAIIAERYSYVPYIGLFMIIGYGYVWIAENKKESIKKLKMPVMLLLGCWIVFLSYTSFNRIKVWKRGDYLFEDILLSYQNQAFVYNNLGFLCYNQVKDTARAEYNYKRSLAVDSTFTLAHRNLGMLNFNLKKYPEALINYNNAIRLNPSNNDYYLERANTLSMLNKDSNAVNDYTVYLSQKQENPLAYHWRGVAYVHLHKNDLAMKDLYKSLELNPNNQESHYWLGLSLYDQKKTNEAIKEISKAITMEPLKSEMYSWRGLMYYNVKNLPAAIADYTKALSLNPNDIASLVNRAIAYKETKQWSNALADIDRVGKMGQKIDRAFYEEIWRNANGK